MANRSYFENQLSLQQSIVHLYAKCQFSTTGPVLSFLPFYSKGFYQVTRSGVGVYQFFMGLSQSQPDNYFGILSFDASSVLAAASGIAKFQITNDSVSSQAAPSFTVTFFNSAGAAVDPANNEQILIHIALRNSSK